MKFPIKAKGQLRNHGMNKTEARYATLLELRRQANEILWYAYEGFKLRLADNTWYTPDFAVMDIDGFLECHEVKGFWRDDARVKIKVAANLYPFTFVAVQEQPKKQGGGWMFERI